MEKFLLYNSFVLLYCSQDSFVPRLHAVYDLAEILQNWLVRDTSIKSRHNTRITPAFCQKPSWQDFYSFVVIGCLLLSFSSACCLLHDFSTFASFNTYPCFPSFCPWLYHCHCKYHSFTIAVIIATPLTVYDSFSLSPACLMSIYIIITSG